jgi:hypothetical protein
VKVPANDAGVMAAVLRYMGRRHCCGGAAASCSRENEEGEEREETGEKKHGEELAHRRGPAAACRSLPGGGSTHSGLSLQERASGSCLLHGRGCKEALRRGGIWEEGLRRDGEGSANRCGRGRLGAACFVD